ncbi:MAG: flagellin [Nitrospirota bacterium]
MGLVINTNLVSLNTQRSLRKTEGPLNTAIQRLSSGLRINSAKDDAAGLAIATRMTTQVNGLSVAMRNANDGVSFAQTAEGAMDEMINGLQRIYELANQASSYNTSTDRGSMNDEVRQLVAELNRIVSQTRYNGELFLNQIKTVTVQVGVEVNETISISSSNVAPTSMGVSTTYSSSLTATDVAVAASRIFNSGGLADAATLNGVGLGSAITTGSDYQNNSVNIINRLNLYTGSTGVTAFAFGNAMVGSSAVAAASASTVVNSGYITINSIAIGSFTAATVIATAAANLASAINAKTSETGVTALVNSDNRIVLANTTGAGVSVSVDAAQIPSGGSSFAAGFASSVSVSAGQNGMIILNDDLTTSTATTNSNDTSGALGYATTSTTISLTATSVNAVTVSDVGNANVTMLAAKKALDTLTSRKGEFGAVMNRLTSTIANLENVRENVISARSRIMDADYAVETANFTRLQIIQQAGISMLAQANLLPQNVLALLGGG